jgi:hypothetical protein
MTQAPTNTHEQISQVPTDTEIDEMVTLLDDLGLAMTAHQHHPLSYLEGVTD